MASSFKKRIENIEKKFEYSKNITDKSRLLSQNAHGSVQFEDGDTGELTQQDILKDADVFSASKHFELHLSQFGPYRIRYTRNGRQLLIGGHRGHVASFDWQTKRLSCEINVLDTLNDVQWLHQETMFAVAQQQWTYIYDNEGIELHCLKSMDRVLRLSFLPYHFLLVGSVCHISKSYSRLKSETGFLHYLDVSIGEMVTSLKTHMGRLSVLAQRPASGVVALGHPTGTVSLWTPSERRPVLKLLTHNGAVRALAADHTDNYMATSGVDRYLKVWDLRNTCRELVRYKLEAAARDLCFSQRHYLAAAVGNIVQVFNDWQQLAESPRTEQAVQTSPSDATPAFTHINALGPAVGVSALDARPLVSHRLARTAQVCQVAFVPHEDVLGVGHEAGFVSLLVPGAGDPGVDALECNPLQTKKQRREKEVKMLLEKIPADMITMNRNQLNEVDEPTLEEKLEAKKKLHWLTVRKVRFTPRHRLKAARSAGRREARKSGVREERRRNQLRDWHDERVRAGIERDTRRAARGKSNSGASSSSPAEAGGSTAKRSRLEGLLAVTISDPDGITIVKAMDSTMEARLENNPSALAIFSHVTRHTGPLAMGPMKFSVAHYNLLQIVQFNHAPLTLSFFARSNTSTGVLLALEPPLRPLLETLKPLVETTH